MPHAALWVVQQSVEVINSTERFGFNAARGFVGGAAKKGLSKEELKARFNAARGFVGGAAMRYYLVFDIATQFQCRTRLCGWCSFVALSSCPPKRKKAFWKVSGNLRCLTENI